MELEIIKRVKVNPKTLFVYIPNYRDNVFENVTQHIEPVTFNGVEYDSIEAIEQSYPELFSKNSRGENCLLLKIDIKTGKVTNWPNYSPYDFFDVKIVDEGEYILFDNEGDVIAAYEGYVPECVGEGGYGDYLEFEIDSASNILEWEFTQYHLDDFMEESGDEIYEDM